MEVLFLLKDLLVGNIELLPMFVFVFFILNLIFIDTKGVAKILRKALLLYVIVVSILRYLT